MAQNSNRNQILLRVDDQPKSDLDTFRLRQELIVSPGVAARQLLRMALAERLNNRPAVG